MKNVGEVWTKEVSWGVICIKEGMKTLETGYYHKKSKSRQKRKVQSLSPGILQAIWGEEKTVATQPDKEQTRRQGETQEKGESWRPREESKLRRSEGSAIKCCGEVI